MNIRYGTSQDFEEIKRIHANQPFKYDFPEWSELVDILVLVDDKDEIQMVLASRKVVELNLLINPDAKLSGLEKWHYIQKLGERANKNLGEQGFKQVFAWIPPEIVKSFGKRLRKIGATFYSWSVAGWRI